MSSSRRNGSVSRAAEAASKNRLHMDRNPQHSRITDPSNPAGRRKEIDNVMKRARQASPGSWDRKLLEVEEKDPNRWRHSGYKQLYLEGAGSASPRRSRSPARRERSPARRDRSPLAARRSPRRTPRRTPPRRSGSVRRRSPRVSPRRSPRRSPRASPRRSPRASPRRSSSGSTGSSCSDESCSVCSANNRDKKRPEPPTPAPPPPKGATIPPRNVKPARAVQPTRELLKAREGSKRTREEKVLEWQRGTAALRPVTIPADRVQIKREGAPVDPRRPPAAAGVSPGAIAAALTLARSRSPSDASLSPPPARLTLSERFGKMAQWSAARAAPAPALDNMRITRDTRRRADTLTVRIEPAAPPPGAYPAELAAAAPAGAPCWDDVTVRYEYYKKRGYLRGLTLADYVKWEEWWYKYQEWLERERAYERWAEPEGRRRERRRGRARHRRS